MNKEDKKKTSNECCSSCFCDGIPESKESWVRDWVDVGSLGVRVCRICGFFQCSTCCLDMETNLRDGLQTFWCTECGRTIAVVHKYDKKGG